MKTIERIEYEAKLKMAVMKLAFAYSNSESGAKPDIMLMPEWLFMVKLIELEEVA